jgi:NADH:ubiquinone oxidoreductase subunit C
LSQEALQLQLSVGFGQGLDPQIVKDSVEVKVQPGQVLNFARFAKEQLGFDLLTSITAVDDIETFQLLYHFVSVRPSIPDEKIEPAYPGYLLARVTVPKGAPDGPAVRNLGDPADYEPVVPSITSIYAGANQQEREIWDLMGIRFKGHPKLERILTWEGFPGHPLRKDWRPLNAEIPWHLAGLTGFGGGTMANAPAVARIADDGSGISQPIPLGTTPESFRHPHTRPARAEETMRVKLGQNGLVDDEGPAGPGTKPLGGAPTRGVASEARQALPEAAADAASPADAGTPADAAPADAATPAEEGNAEEGNAEERTEAGKPE